MKKSVKIVIAILLVIVVALGVIIFAGKSQNKTNTENDSSSSDSENSSSDNSSEIVESEQNDDSISELSHSDIYVEKIIDDDFITGVDVSSFLSEINAGVTYKDFDGNSLDAQGFFNLLADGGVNYVRIRVWNNPTDENGNFYGGGNCDLDTAVQIGQYATNAGMKVLINFHYSDFWADPAKQTAPKSWSDMDIDEKTSALYDYTLESLETLIDNGVDVGMVQIGNETNNGIAGEDTWENMCKLFASGSSAVRYVADEYDKDIMVAVHFTNPENEGSYVSIASYLDKYGVDYDVFASSYYPYWHGTLDNLTSVLSDIADTYDKKVMVAETSYVRTLEDGDGHTNTEYEGKVGDAFDYDISVQGQAHELSAVAKAVSAVGDAGIGMFYWEPAWIPVNVYDEDADDVSDVLEANKKAWEEYGCGWASSYAGDYDEDAKEWYGGSAVDNEAWFDFYGNALETVNIYKYMRTGTDASKSVLSVTAESVNIALGEDVVLPDSVTVLYNTGDTEDVSVTWDTSNVDNNTKGIYEEAGKVNALGRDIDVTCTVTVSSANLLQDPGFEDGANDSAWTITDNAKNNAASIKDDSNNVRTGSYCLHFWAESDISFKVEQTMTLSAGTYTFGGFLQGGDCGDDAEFIIYIKDGDDIISEYSSVTSWQNWDNPEISGFTLDEDSEITVGFSVQAAANGWGSWDDFYLYEE